MNENLSPWQRGPTEIILTAIEQLHQGSGHNRRIAFLLFDLGLETLCKTYLTLSSKITGAKGSHSSRKKSASGNFHEMLEGVSTSTPSPVDDADLKRVLFYHDVRNKLYHEGSGISVYAWQATDYGILAVKLLAQLLDVNLKAELDRPELEAKELAEREQLLLDKSAKIKKSATKVEHLITLAIEKIEPRLLLPSYVDKLDNLCSERPGFSDDAFRKLVEFVRETIDDEHIRDHFLRRADDSGDLFAIGHLASDICSRENLYWEILECKLPAIKTLAWQYKYSAHYPASVSQPMYAVEEYPEDEFDVVEVERPLSKILDEGDQVTSDLDKLCGIIQNWVDH